MNFPNKAKEPRTINEAISESTSVVRQVITQIGMIRRADEQIGHICDLGERFDNAIGVLKRQAHDYIEKL